MNWSIPKYLLCLWCSDCWGYVSS